MNNRLLALLLSDSGDWMLALPVARTMQVADFVLQHTFEFKTEENEKVKEDVGADVKENYVQYHRQDDDSEVTVIEDFNRVSKSDACTQLYLP